MTSSRIRSMALKGDPVALTRAMVAIPSVNPELEEGGAGEEAMARQCASWLESWGLESRLQEVAPGRWNVVARLVGDRSGRRLILNGHLDTVGVRGMPGDPYSAQVTDGTIRGRGACDMKAGLGILLATAAEAARTGIRGELVVALTADEEHASLGMQHFVAEGLGGGMPLEADGAVVCEPTSLKVMPAHKGFFWVNAEFRGRAAHGSRPDEGVDAIAHAARFLTALAHVQDALLNSPPHPLLAHGSLHAGTIRGGTAPSVYPAHCELVVERRTLPGEDAQTVLAELQDVLERVQASTPDMKAKLIPGLFRAGTAVPEESDMVRILLESLRAEGLEEGTEGMTAWVDAAFLNEAGIPAVCFGPGSIAQAHSADEWVAVKEIEAGARVLGRFAKTFLAGQG